MSRQRVIGVPAFLWMSQVILFAVGLQEVCAQNKGQAASKDDSKLGWSNATDLSLVVTNGNSNSATLGFSDQLRHVWKQARFEFEVTGVRSNKSDDRYLLVTPGLEFLVGSAPANPSTSLVKPEPTLDVENYLVRGTYERDLSPKLFWSAGVSWDRNKDAGIRNRYIGYGGVGNKWWENERRRFTTSYSLSYTDREEVEPDPEKDRRFAGARFGWDYIERFNTATSFDSNFALNLNLSKRTDYSISTLNALTVSVANHVSIKLSLQWLFENEPALETLDVIAYVEVLNPDRIPGTGDESFRTLASGGTKVVLGSSSARRDKLDTIIRSALVLRF